MPNEGHSNFDINYGEPIQDETPLNDESYSPERIEAMKREWLIAQKNERISILSDQEDAAALLGPLDPFSQTNISHSTSTFSPKDTMTPRGTSTESSEIPEKSAILERLKKTTFDFLGQTVVLDINKVTLKKQWENYLFTSTASWFGYIKTPLEVNKRWDLLTTEIVFDRGSNFLLPKNGVYKISQEGERVRIQEKFSA